MRKLIAGIVLASVAAFAAHGETEAEKKQREWGERLAAFFGQAGVDQKAVDEQAAAITALQDALKQCGDCKEKKELTARLTTVRGTPRRGRWSRARGEPKDSPNYIPEGEVVAKMRKEGVAADCIAFYRQYTACEREAQGGFTATRGPCADDFLLYEHCRKGDAKAFAEVAARRSARAGGAMIPRIDGDAAHFGRVPGDFNPPVPPPSYLEGRRHIALFMTKDEEGALIQVWLKPLADYLYHYLYMARSNVYRPELTRQSLEKIEAMGRAAAEIKNAYVITCGYRADKGGSMRVSSYWWDKRPDASPKALRIVESGGTAIARYGKLLEKAVPIGRPARTRCPDQW